ncbi:MAG: cysteine desulfurase [Verrucomicrobia bacterium]|nr:cysteine desulfurase [Verrucomicrobiota bacterium]
MVYLDHAASSPCLPIVVDAMAPFWTNAPANPSSISHAFGRAAADAVELSRSQVAALAGALPEEVIFTSSTTEANNLAICGHISHLSETKRASERIHVLTVATEHKSVLGPMEYQRTLGVDVEVIDCVNDGTVDLGALKRAIRPNTALISVMWANNEIGTINPMLSILEFCRERRIPLHTDAAQAAGKVEIRTRERPEFISFGAHKLGGPKGVGALIVRGLASKHSIAPIIFGGGQEYGLRAGTLNVAAVVGFGVACREVAKDLTGIGARLRILRDLLEDRILEAVSEAIVNSRDSNRLPHISSITLPVRNGVDVIEKFETIACSSGSACLNHDNQQSHVLNAMGIRGQAARSTVRFSVGWNTTREEISIAVEEVRGLAKRYSK